jgi:hypothetical protein
MVRLRGVSTWGILSTLCTKQNYGICHQVGLKYQNIMGQFMSIGNDYIMLVIWTIIMLLLAGLGMVMSEALGFMNFIKNFHGGESVL